MEPYYERAGITLYHADCRDVLPGMSPRAFAALVTDPPYGIKYASGMTGHDGGTALRGIDGDADTSLRDFVLGWYGDGPAVVFGSWKRPRPEGCHTLLVWEKGDHVGMGDLSVPWKPNTEEVYVLGKGFKGHRGSSVLRYNAPVTWNSVSHGRSHAHEKPVALMEDLIGKCPAGVVLDPFAGSGSTGVAAYRLGRECVLIEKDEEWAEETRARLDREISQGRLFTPEPSSKPRQLEIAV